MMVNYVKFTEDAILEGAVPWLSTTEEPTPMEEPTWTSATADSSSKEAIPTRESMEELAVDTKQVGMPHTPPVPCEKKADEEGQQVQYPGMTEVLHPTQPVASIGQTPPTLGKLRG